jgi:hypothetical protein
MNGDASLRLSPLAIVEVDDEGVVWIVLLNDLHGAV